MNSQNDDGVPPGKGSRSKPTPGWIATSLDRISVAGALMAGRARARLLAFRGARIGAKVRVGTQCRFERPWCVTLGERAVVEDDVCIKVTTDGAAVRIGAFAFVGRGTQIDASQEVVVGDHALIAPGCFVTDHSHKFANSRKRIDEQGCEEKPVRIGDDAWLGTGAIILMGVTIGDGAIVGAGSVVRHSVPEREIHAGVPARKLGERR